MTVLVPMTKKEFSLPNVVAPVILGSALLMIGCGSDDKPSPLTAPPKNYDGLVPEFSSAYATSDNKLTIGDCSKSGELISQAPQSIEHQNQTALQLIQNLQAHLISDDCINRDRIIKRPASISRQNLNNESLVTVTSEQINGNGNDLRIWQMQENGLTNKDLRTHIRGFFYENDPDSNRRKRSDITHFYGADGSSEKRIRVLRQTDFNGTRDIRTAFIQQKHDTEGKITEQKVSARIASDNYIYVATAAIKPGLGALTYLKKCNNIDAQSSNDYSRSCNGNWQVLSYDKDGNLNTNSNDVLALFSAFSLDESGIDRTSGSSILPEQKFYAGQSEEEFFSKREFDNLNIVKTESNSELRAEVTGKNVILQWPPSGSGVTYTLHRQKTGSDRPTLVSVQLMANSYTDKDLSAGSYRYFLTSCSSDSKCNTPIISSLVTIP